MRGVSRPGVASGDEGYVRSTVGYSTLNNELNCSILNRTVLL